MTTMFPSAIVAETARDGMELPASITTRTILMGEMAHMQAMADCASVIDIDT